MVDVLGNPLPPEGTFGAGLRFQPPYPTRIKSAKGQPPNDTKFMRGCKTCGASFAQLAAGRSGETGLWTNDMRWYCSVECYPGEVPEAWITPREHQEER